MDLCTQSKKTERERKRNRENERTFHSKENPADKARTKLKLNKMPLTLGEPEGLQ